MSTMTPERVMAIHMEDRVSPDFERRRCEAAGRDLGEEDKQAGIFDDTPPASMVGQSAEIYRTAYREINPPH